MTSLPRAQFELLNRRFCVALAEAFAEVGDDGIEDEKEIERRLQPAMKLSQAFLGTAVTLQVDFAQQFIAVAMLMGSLMAGYDAAPVDLEKVPVTGKKAN